MELHDPKSRKWAAHSLKVQANRHYVICEGLRLIYDELCKKPVDKAEIERLLIDCFIMGKKMSDRLHYYQNTYQDMTGKRGKGIPEFKSRRDRRIVRRKREGLWTPQ